MPHASLEELIEHVRRRMGPVHAPKHVYVVAELPMAALRRVDKKALLAALRGGFERVLP